MMQSNQPIGLKLPEHKIRPFAGKDKAQWFSVFILAIAAAIFVTAELLPVGILSEIGVSFHQPIGKVGLMVTGYAWTVALSAFLITSWLAPLERRALLLAIMLIFFVANLLVAFSPSLSWLFIARVIGAFSHGVFWSIVGPLSIRLVENMAKAKATAIVFGGMAVASIFAVPIGTLLAQSLGWRSAFISIAAISLLIAIAIMLQFPRLHGENKNYSYIKKLPILLNNSLLKRLFPATALALTGHFCAFTYISALLEKRMGIDEQRLPLYLFLFGISGVVGNAFSGMLSDRVLRHACQLTLLSMAIVLMLMSYLQGGTTFFVICLVVIWGMGMCLLTVTLQSLILTVPQSIAGAASAMHVSMFNIGIGAGALLGGYCIDNLSVQLVALVGSFALFASTIIMLWPLNKQHIARI